MTSDISRDNEPYNDVVRAFNTDCFVKEERTRRFCEFRQQNLLLSKVVV